MAYVYINVTCTPESKIRPERKRDKLTFGHSFQSKCRNFNKPFLDFSLKIMSLSQMIIMGGC